jgi:CSLREA domain-containing protein
MSQRPLAIALRFARTLPRLLPFFMLFAHWDAMAQGLFVVTKATDTADGACDADCSLREAVIAANASPGADEIRLTRAYYRLTQAGDGDDEDSAIADDLDLTDDVTIRGLPDRTVLDLNGLSRGFQVMPKVKAELIDLTIRNGKALGRGGAIWNQGELTLRGVWLNRNSVMLEPVGVLRGGAVYNQGVLRMNRCIVQQNQAIDSASLTGGTGGGVFNAAGAQLYLYDTVVRYNVTGTDDIAGFGGGLFNWGRSRIDRSYFGHNDAGDGEGSAISNRAGGSLALLNSTLSGNGHDGSDAALANGTTVEPRESLPKANVSNATIAANNGGGLLNTGRLTMRNTIVGGNYTQDGNDRYYDAGRNCRNEGDGKINEHYSLLGADGNCTSAYVSDNRHFFLTELEPLRYLGGPSPVHAPRPGSMAIDGGDPTLCPDRDQRDARRPADGDLDGSLLCDIGAMEVNADE